VTDTPPIRAVYETVLYASELAPTVAFYAETVGLREIERPNEHSAAFRLPDGGLLLIFEPEQSAAAGRFVPSHGTSGAGHTAFRLEPGGLGTVATDLKSKGVEIEREITWPRGGRSVSVRDPAGNSVEFVEGEIWDA
jgi:catechol 2,3-dioxygenase-like lactoylglutathione lyase family enzyme